MIELEDAWWGCFDVESDDVLGIFPGSRRAHWMVQPCDLFLASAPLVLPCRVDLQTEDKRWVHASGLATPDAIALQRRLDRAEALLKRIAGNLVGWSAPVFDDTMALIREHMQEP